MELVVHGHFYQPPREDPWTGEVPEEFGAAPDHDWNERIAAECYRPNALARVYTNGLLRRWHNNYAALSFDLGPTLAYWLERHEPVILRRFVGADHGNALAHPYFHSILPLCDAVDRSTLVRWGLAEFQHRFRRQPEGMWLPETAVDNATLAALAEHDVAFSVLSPTQAARVRSLSGGPWSDVRGGRIDPARTYWWRHPDGSGRGLALFFFDGPLAHDVAFGTALASTEAFASAVFEAGRRSAEGFVHLAVDGETFGHHHRYGERVLAHSLYEDLPRRGVRVTHYAAALASRPPRDEVEIELGPRGEGSAWSCPHGLGRWRRDCGCRLRAETRQEWREPLRAALDFLRDHARAFFLEQATPLLVDPWAARDAWVETLLVPTPRREARVLARHGRPHLARDERLRVARLMALQRQLLAMYTSCGWFFDDIAGLESVLVLRQAACALDTWEDLGGQAPRAEVLDLLAAARSNRREAGSGADVLRRQARPSPRSVLGPPRARPLVAALRAWLGGTAAAALVLDTIAAGVEERELLRAQELFAMALSDGSDRPDRSNRLAERHTSGLASAGGREIAAALGFAEQVFEAVAAEDWVPTRGGSGA